MIRREGWTEAEEIKAILMPKQNDKHRNRICRT